MALLAAQAGSSTATLSRSIIVDTNNFVGAAMQAACVSSVLWESNVRRQRFAGKVAAAAAGGFATLTVPARIVTQESSAGVSARDMLAIAGDSGVALDFLDGMSSWASIRFPAGVDVWIREALDYSPEECLDMCDALGMKSVVAIGAFDPGALPVAELVESFARFCDQAERRGIWVDLEAMPMLGIPDLHMAWEIVRQADRPNSGLMLDTWHFMRGRPDFDLLRSIPAGRIVNIQVVDAMKNPRGANLWEDALRYRMFPGEGELPLLQILEILRLKGGIRTAGPEIFSDEIDAMSAEEAGRRSAQTTNAVLAKAGFQVRTN